MYAVTNRHVIEAGDLTIRLNRKGGGIDVINTSEDDWCLHEDGDDVAVYSIDVGNWFRHWSVGTDTFLTQEMIEAYTIGYGDDVFMVGRLVSQSSVQKNSPVIRFGNISLMSDPSEPIRCNKEDREAYLVECRSISGFSGSPVFVYCERFYTDESMERLTRYRRSRMTDRELEAAERMKPVSHSGTIGPFLLGADFCHLPNLGKVYYKGKPHKEYEAEINTGIAAVVPAWKILEILENPRLTVEREEGDIRLAVKYQHNAGDFVPDVAPAEDVETFTEQDFEADLRRVTRRVGTSEPDLGTK